MCRWLAYSGPPIHLDTLIFKPENSLISQSRHAYQSVSPTNGDGFGIGWYDSRPEPGRFRDTLPAWNDENLCSLSEQIRSRLFFAHVRASTGTATTRTNCHPFRYGRWLFMHNGQIGGFERIRRDLVLRIAPDYFGALQGSTDSEVFFLLLLGNGLDADPIPALERTVAEVEGVMAAAGIEQPLRITAAMTEGSCIHAVRYASDGHAPTLYYGLGGARLAAAGGDDGLDNALMILSEPLDQVQEHWVGVPESHVLLAGDGGLGVVPFRPKPVAAGHSARRRDGPVGQIAAAVGTGN